MADGKLTLGQVLDLIDRWVQQNPSMNKFETNYYVAGGTLTLTFERPSPPHKSEESKP
jgi:hypothetical protein